MAHVICGQWPWALPAWRWFRWGPCRRFRWEARRIRAFRLAEASHGRADSHVIPGGGGPHRPAPTDTYFSHFGLLNDGDYGDALKAFKIDLSSGIKTSESRWIDSICYYTMVGECYYHLGEYRNALDNYDAALRLYIAFPNWMMQLQFPGTLQMAPLLSTPPWGHSTAGRSRAKFPSISPSPRDRCTPISRWRKGA